MNDKAKELITSNPRMSPEERFEKAYNIGYEDGYIAAVIEMGRRLKGMEWYGGNYKKERTAGVPADHEAGTGNMQH